jgi:hypothetical protein
MSRIPTTSDRMGVAGPPDLAGVSGWGAALSVLGGGTAQLAGVAKQEALAARSLEVETAVNDARREYLRGLDDLDRLMADEPNPEAAARGFEDGRRRLRERVLGPDGPAGTLAGSEYQQRLEGMLGDLETPAIAAAKRAVRAKITQRSVATLEADLQDLTLRAAASDDPLERIMLDQQLAGLLASGQQQAIVDPVEAGRLARDARMTIESQRTTRDAEGVAYLLAEGADPEQALRIVDTLRGRAKQLGMDPDLVAKSLASGVSSVVGALAADQEWERAGAIIGVTRDAVGAKAAGELASQLRNEMGREASDEINRRLRALRSGAASGVEFAEQTQNLINASAPITGEDQALRFTVALNQAQSDGVARTSAVRRQVAKASATSDWVRKSIELSLEPGRVGFVDFEPETAAVLDDAGNAIDTIEITADEKRAALVEAAAERFEAEQQRLMSADPAERAEALAVLAPGSGDLGPLSEANAQAVRMTAELRWSMRNTLPNERLKGQIRQVSAQGVSAIEQMMAGGEAPRDSAYEQLYRVWSLLEDDNMGMNEYLPEAEQAVLREIHRQYTRGSRAGEFWPSARLAAMAIERRVQRGGRPLEVPDEIAKKAARDSVGLNWFEIGAGWTLNRGADVIDGLINVPALLSGGEMPIPGQVLGRFSTAPGQMVRNLSQVEQWMKETIGIMAAEDGDFEGAAKQALQLYRSNHVRVNDRAVYVGSQAKTAMIQQLVAGGEFDRAIDRFYRANAEVLAEAGIDREDLEMRPLAFDDPSRWQIVNGEAGGAIVGDGILGVDVFQSEAMYRQMQRRRSERIAEQNRATQARRAERGDAFDLSHLSRYAIGYFGGDLDADALTRAARSFGDLLNAARGVDPRRFDNPPGQPIDPEGLRRFEQRDFRQADPLETIRPDRDRDPMLEYIQRRLDEGGNR